MRLFGYKKAIRKELERIDTLEKDIRNKLELLKRGDVLLSKSPVEDAAEADWESVEEKVIRPVRREVTPLPPPLLPQLRPQPVVIPPRTSQEEQHRMNELITRLKETRRKMAEKYRKGIFDVFSEAQASGEETTAISKERQEVVLEIKDNFERLAELAQQYAKKKEKAKQKLTAREQSVFDRLGELTERISTRSR